MILCFGYVASRTHFEFISSITFDLEKRFKTSVSTLSMVRGTADLYDVSRLVLSLMLKINLLMPDGVVSAL